MDRYFECSNCGQVVQGWGASRDILCCANKDMVEIEGPDWQSEAEQSAADLDDELETQQDAIGRG